MGTGAVALALALAASQFASGAGSSTAAMPKDPCALLIPAEVQALTPNTSVGKGVNATQPDGMGSVACRWEWGSGCNAQGGRYDLDVTVMDGSRAWPGTDPEDIKTGLLLLVKPGDANTAVISGVGDAAVYESNAEIRAETRAYVKGMMLLVTLEGPDARTKKNQVISLLKAAAGRL
jgi:hypothetical protein